MIVLLVFFDLAGVNVLDRRAHIELLFHFSFLEQCRHESRSVDLNLLRKLVKAIFDLVLALDSFLLHFLIDLLHFFFLLLLKLMFLIHVFFFSGTGYLQFELLLYFLVGLVFSFSMIFLELSDFVLFLLMELLESFPGLFYYLFHPRIDHHLLHLETHLRLEA